MRLSYLREECGVLGIYSFSGERVSNDIYKGLVAIQHRGQDSGGIATFGGRRMHLKKGIGLISEIFSQKDLEKLKGNVGIGNVRYPTTGSSSFKDAQPFYIRSPFKGMCISHNGNLVNYPQAKKEVQASGTLVSSSCDAELILHVFAAEYRKTKDIFSAVRGVFDKLEGGYVETIVTGDGRLIVFREPGAVKPLCFAKGSDRVIFASESVALDANGMDISGHVAPGEVVVVDEDGIERKVVKKAQRSHCMFEYVYFSRPDSTLDAGNVYKIRRKLGRNLARSAPVKADVVVPVPDTSRPAAEEFAKEAGIPLEEGLMKNRYVARTFIMPSQRKREESVFAKLNPFKEILRGKRVVLIDDSIVRGTTTKAIVRMVRAAGAKEVHVRITCPPLRGPCFYGIDIPSFHDLIAFSNPVDRVKEIIGADSLGYQTLEGLVDAIGKESLCLGCLTQKYPTPMAQRIADKMKKTNEKRRYWEIEPY